LARGLVEIRYIIDIILGIGITVEETIAIL
jgi:hypothetical protein